MLLCSFFLFSRIKQLSTFLKFPPPFCPHILFVLHPHNMIFPPFKLASLVMYLHFIISANINFYTQCYYRVLNGGVFQRSTSSTSNHVGPYEALPNIICSLCRFIMHPCFHLFYCKKKSLVVQTWCAFMDYNISNLWRWSYIEIFIEYILKL